MDLTNADLTELKNFLLVYFDRGELHELAFEHASDLHMDREMFRSHEFAHKLIDYCHRRGELKCLVMTVMKERPRLTEKLKGLLEKLPPCTIAVKVQIILNTSDPSLNISIKQKIADVFGISENEVGILGLVEGSLRILVSVPETKSTADHLQKIVKSLPDLVVSIVLFSALSSSAKMAWKYIFFEARPSFHDQQRNEELEEHREVFRERMYPTITWTEAVKNASLLMHAGNFPFRVSSIENRDKNEISYLERERDSVPPPIDNMMREREPMPVEGHVKVEQQYHWYEVERHSAPELMPFVRPGDWLLVYEIPEVELVRRLADPSLVIVYESGNDGTIQLKPQRPGTRPLAGQRIHLQHITLQTGPFVIENGQAIFRKEAEPVAIDLADILGIVVGFWRPVSK